MIPHQDIPKRYAILGLLLILALATWMRFDGLGRFSFWTDELYHVVAAQSLLDTGEPMIPARGVYWRAFFTTGVTAASFGVFGESEWSARMPFAVITLITLLVAYKIIADRFSRTLALITVLFMGTSPQLLQVGRECRMYAIFVLFYFLGVFATYRAVEGPPGGERRTSFQVFLGLLLAAPLFAVATSQQFLALNFGIALAVYCLIMAGYECTQTGAGKALSSRYVVLPALMIIACLAVWLAAPKVAAVFISLARTQESWDTRGRPAPYCVWFFQYYYPALTFVYPLGAVLLIKRFGRLGLFVVCCFVPMLLAHMYFFTARIADRYLVYLLPFFFLTSAAVIEAMGFALVNWLRQLKQERARLTAVAAVVAALPVLWLFMYPWFEHSRELRRYGLGPDWKQIAGKLHKTADNSTVFTNWPRETIYYAGQLPDYFVTVDYETDVAPSQTLQVGDHTHEIHVVSDADALAQALRDHPDAVFITTDWAFYNNAFMTDAMRALILDRMTESVSVAAGNDRAVLYQSK